MTRLEEIEAWLTKSVRSLIEHRPDHEMAHRLIYRGDCYRARVAVLEEAVNAWELYLGGNAQLYADGPLKHYDEAWRKVKAIQALTPEECLERQARQERIDKVRGSCAHLPGGVDAFLADKHAERTVGDSLTVGEEG